MISTLFVSKLISILYSLSGAYNGFVSLYWVSSFSLFSGPIFLKRKKIFNNASQWLMFAAMRLKYKWIPHFKCTKLHIYIFIYFYVVLIAIKNLIYSITISKEMKVNAIADQYCNLCISCYWCRFLFYSVHKKIQ